MTRWALVKRFKGVWDIVKTKDGAWVLFEDREKVEAEQRKAIDEQTEENRGLRNDVLLMQKEDASQRALIEQQAQHIKRLEERTWTDNVKFIAEAKENLLQQYVNLTTIYGEQKHTVRDQAKEIERLNDLIEHYKIEVQGQAREIARLQELLARIAHNCEEDESDALLKMHIHTLAKQALK